MEWSRSGAVLIGAFSGWNDAADSATAAVDWLQDAWDARPTHSLDAEEYYDYQVLRPIVDISEGVIRELRWRGSRVMVARPDGLGRTVLLLSGAEPSFHWRRYCTEVAAVAEEHQVSQVVLLGAFLAATPHSRPVPIVGAAHDAEAARALGLERTEYEGPTGITGALHAHFAGAGISTVSLFAAVPHYAAEPTCAKATLALMRRLEDMLDISIPYGSLPERVRQWEQEIDAAIRDDEDLVEFVRRLEEQAPINDLREASGDQIAREFERYLRRRGPEEGTTS